MEKTQDHQHVIDMLTTLRTGVEADVHFVCGEKEYPAHKLILKINSPYFVAMFNSGLEECKSGKVCFPKLDPATLEAVLDFIYFGKVEAIKTRQELENVLEASHLMQINKLFLHCCEALLKLLSPDCFMRLLAIAQKYEKNAMVEVIMDYLVTHHENIFSSNSYLCATYEQVKFLVGYLDGKVKCVDNVLKGVLNWLTHSVSCRESFTGVLLDLVDSTLLSKLCITELLADKHVMATSTVINSKVKEIAMMVLTSDSCPPFPPMPVLDKRFRRIIFFSDCCEDLVCDDSNVTSVIKNSFELLHQNPCKTVTSCSSGRRYVNSMQQFDIQSGSWLPVNFLVYGGFKGVAMCQYGQYVYMVGGPLGSNCNKCHVNGELLEVFNTNLPRTMNAGMCQFQDHLFLVGGGLNTNSEPQSTVYYTTTDQSTWCEDNPLNSPRSSPTVMASAEYLYVAGGSYSEKFSWPTVEYTRLIRNGGATTPNQILEPWTNITFPQTPMAIHPVVIQDKLYALYCVKQYLVIMRYETESSKWLVKTFPLPSRDSCCQPLGLGHVFYFSGDQSKHVFVSTTLNHDIPNYTIDVVTGQWKELPLPQGICGVSGAVRVCAVGI